MSGPGQPSVPVRPVPTAGAPGPAPLSASPRRGLSLGKRVLFLAAILGGSLLLALLLLEVVVRVAMPQPLAPPLYTETPYGFGVLPGLRGLAIQTDDRRTYRVTTDAHGFRGRRPVAAEPPSGTRRVLVLGDSFTFGVGVEDDETFVARAEEALNAGGRTQAGEPAPLYEVINAGCPGWGTENELAFWRQKGRALRPDLVVVAYFQNDLFDNLRGQVYEVRDGRVEPAAPRRPTTARRVARAIPLYGFLCSHSHLVNLVRRSLASRAAGLPKDEKDTEDGKDGKDRKDINDEKDKENQDDQEDLKDRRIADGREIAESQAILPSPPSSFILPHSSFIFHPSSFVLPPSSFPPPSSPLSRELAVYVPLMQALLDDAAREGVPVLLLILPWSADLDGPPTPHFTEVARLAAAWERERPGLATLDAYEPLLAAHRRGDDLFLPVDRHFTPAAHRLVGDLLAARIRTMLDPGADRRSVGGQR